MLLTVLIISILLGIGFTGLVCADDSGTREGRRIDPVFNGGYMKIIWDHGCKGYKHHPLTEEGFFQSYSDMREIGVDMVANGDIAEYRVNEIADKLGLSAEDCDMRFGRFRRRLQAQTKSMGFSPKEYSEKTIDAIQANQLDFWVFSYHGAYRIDEYLEKKDIILEQFRESARQFSGYDGFLGFAYSEQSAGRNYEPALLAEFKAHLLSKYPGVQLSALGLGQLTNSAVKLLLPTSSIMVDAEATPWLFKKYSEFLRARLLGRGFEQPDEAAVGDSVVSTDEFKKWILMKHSPEDLEVEGLGILARNDTVLILPASEKTEEQPDGMNSDMAEITADIDVQQDDGDSGGSIVMPTGYSENPVLYVEYEEFLGKLYTDMLSEMDSVLAEMKPGARTVPNLGFGSIMNSPIRCSVAQLGRACGAISVEPYCDGAQEEAFWAKLLRNQARGPSFLTICAGGKYSSGPQMFARDIALCMIHSPALQIWSWGYVWKSPCESHAAFWKKNHYEITKKMFERIDKVKEYLAPTESVAKVALVYSERELMWDQGDAGAGQPSSGFMDNCYGLHCAFSQLGIQYEPIFEQLITEEEIEAYQVVILPGVSYLRPESVSAIRNMVNKGGNLIILGEAGTRDRWGRRMETSSLKELPGVTSSVMTGLTHFVYASGDKRVDVDYESELIAAKYVPDGAEIIGVWDGGEPAIAVNSFGQGKVFCVGASLMGVCHEGWGDGVRFSERYRHSLFSPRKTYLPGVLDFLNRIIQLASTDERDDVPLQNSVRPAETEITVRRQPGRYIVHLLNYVPEAYPTVSGAEITIRIPEGNNLVSVFYPLDRSRAVFSMDGKNLTVNVRDFDVHEMIVVQFDGKPPELNPEREGAFVFDIPKSSESRSVAFFGLYPGVSVARKCGIPIEEYPSSFLDTPIDYKRFSRKHFMIAYNGRALNELRMKHLEKYVSEGGFLQYFIWNGVAGKTDLLSGLTSARNKAGEFYYSSRIRFKGDCPFLDGIKKDEWLEVDRSGSDPLRCESFNAASTNDVLAEAELMLYHRGVKLTDISKGVHPVVVFRKHGEGWVMKDVTASAISSSGRLSPSFKTLASNILKWASTRKWSFTDE